MIEVYIFPEGGGTSIKWEGDICNIECGFFWFGRYGGGWLPFPMKDPDKWIAGAKEAVKRLFNEEIQVHFRRP